MATGLYVKEGAFQYFLQRSKVMYEMAHAKGQAMAQPIAEIKDII